MRLAIMIAVIAVAVLLVGAAIGPYFVPTRTYQKVVEEALADKLNARIVIDEFSLRLIPYPGYTISGFSLISKEPPFRGMPIVEADKVIGGLTFGALFGGDLDTDIEARDVRVYYRSSGGVSNIGRLLGFMTSLSGSRPLLPPVRELTPSIPAIKALPPAGGDAGSDVPDAPLDTVPSMPAPSIEVPTDQGSQSQQRQQRKQRFLSELILREALASGGFLPDRQAGESGRPVTLKKLEIVRGRIEFTSDRSSAPLVIDSVSFSARNLSLKGGFTAKVKMSGRLNDPRGVGINLEGEVIADSARSEVSFRNGRLYFGGAQLIADFVYGYGLSPPSMDVHLASPNLSQDALAPLFSYLGMSLPDRVSWQGALGADLSFKGTSDAGQLMLQLDATPARVALGESFMKEPGIPFKVHADVIVKPSTFTLGDGKLTLEGNDVKLTGEVVREGDMRSKVMVSGAELSLAAVRSLLPWLPDLDSLEGGSVDLELSGSLFGSEGMNVDGRVGAQSVKVAGIELEDISGSFAKEKERVEFTTLRGDFAGGKFSGNGKLDIGKKTTMEFDVVVSDMDMGEIPSLKGAVTGRASMVAKAESFGADRFELLKNFSVSGSFLTKDAKIAGLGGAAGLFSKGTWRDVAERSAAELGQSAEKELEGVGDEVKELNASFEMKEDRIKAESISWDSEGYSAEVSVDMSEAGSLSGGGIVAVNKDVSSKLVAGAEARKKLLDSRGRLLLPVKCSGTLMKSKLVLDDEKLAALIEERLRLKPMLDLAREEAEAVGEVKALEAPAISMPAGAPTTDVEEAAADVKAPKKGAPKKTATKRKAPAKKRQEPAFTDQSIEDILKVIIGN